MPQQLPNRLLFLAFWMFALMTCYWVGARYGFAAGGGNGQNCNNCPCKDVTAWQVALDGASEAHGFQQQTQQSPPIYTAILTAQLNISTIPNSCTNNTGDTYQTNGTYANWFYVNAATVCAKGVLPQEMSVSDKGVMKAAASSVLNCKVP